MIDISRYFINTLWFMGIFWFLATDYHYMKTGNLKLIKFDFNRKNYYLLTTPFIIGAIIESLFARSLVPIVIFIGFGVAGVIGESLFSWWWNSMFKKRFWVYREETVWHGYTSLLNFLPWGMGGFLYLGFINVSQNFRPGLIFDAKLWCFLVFLGAWLVSLLSAYFLQTRRKFKFELKEFNIWTYLLFVAPILLTVSYLTFFVDGIFGIIAVGFGIGSFVEEYIFGKLSEIIVSKKLWYYNFWTFDNAHSTVLNIIPFMMSGFYFWIVYLGLSFVIKN